MLRPSDFKDWQEYYWTYQNVLARKYLIPMLEGQGIRIDGSRVFEIGCGSGGVIEAFAERCQVAVGLDIAPFDYTHAPGSKVRYITADIFDPEHASRYAGTYDVILLRDVIEHLPSKALLFERCAELLDPQGVMLVTFPPFYSPFGAHQQVHARRRLGKLPFLHWMGRRWYVRYLRMVEKNNEGAVRAAEELFDTKTSIRSLNREIRHSSFEIQHQEYYVTRPSYEIRYGIRPMKAQFLRHVPLLREWLVMGVYMILRKKPASSNQSR